MNGLPVANLRTNDTNDTGWTIERPWSETRRHEVSFTETSVVIPAWSWASGDPMPASAPPTCLRLYQYVVEHRVPTWGWALLGSVTDAATSAYRLELLAKEVEMATEWQRALPERRPHSPEGGDTSVPFWADSLWRDMSAGENPSVHLRVFGEAVEEMKERGGEGWSVVAGSPVGQQVVKMLASRRPDAVGAVPEWVPDLIAALDEAERRVHGMKRIYRGLCRLDALIGEVERHGPDSHLLQDLAFDRMAPSWVSRAAAAYLLSDAEQSAAHQALLRRCQEIVLATLRGSMLPREVAVI